jgi:outer membrane receptor protein involved in Fe transport
VAAEARTGGARLSVTGFLREADELIDFARPVGSDPETTPWRSRNVESATFRGLEIEAATAVPLGIRMKGALELLSVDAEAAAGFVSKRALRPITERVRLEARRSLGSGLTAAVRWTSASRRGGEEPFHLLDARVAYRWGDWDLYLEGSNLTDDRYPDITGRRAPGAALVAGLTWKGGD